jgi:hypothetical protein
MVDVARMLLWSIDETTGFDSAWVRIDADRMTAEGRACGLSSSPFWVSYTLETSGAYATSRVAAQSRWEGGSAVLDLRRDDAGWTVNDERRPDLDGALDCDVAYCLLTNTMPILRHGLHRKPGEHDLLMAFIEVPSLQVAPNLQHYTHLRANEDGGGLVRYSSGWFQSDLTIDRDGFVVDYPQLGRRVEANV